MIRRRADRVRPAINGPTSVWPARWIRRKETVDLEVVTYAADVVAAAAQQLSSYIACGEHFWARGYAVSTVGFELEQVRNYIREQDAADGAGGQF